MSTPPAKAGGFGLRLKAGSVSIPRNVTVDSAKRDLRALALWRGYNAETPPHPVWIDSALVKTNLLAPENLALIAVLREDQTPSDSSRTKETLAQGNGLLVRAASLLEAARSN